ncbi:hypothetical protein [Agrobacterium vitis]|uniref:Uncharacterized protein n=1 Tax=Agrobacterium vitis TaxID=373 RepID=A0AAE2RBA7_AGRVI|nr:hypothetical protein [Agrobacterium vitis]MBF2715078.1 hypothetical protein [Agrobacterium vitis]
MTANKASRNALIEQKRKDGATLAALAREFKISQTAVSQPGLGQARHNRRAIERRLEASLRRVTKPYDGE